MVVASFGAADVGSQQLMCACVCAARKFLVRFAHKTSILTWIRALNSCFRSPHVCDFYLLLQCFGLSRFVLYWIFFRLATRLDATWLLVVLCRVLHGVRVQFLLCANCNTISEIEYRQLKECCIFYCIAFLLVSLYQCYCCCFAWYTSILVFARIFHFILFYFVLFTRICIWICVPC